MVIIGVDQTLSKSALHENKSLKRNNKLYKSSGKCDDKNLIKLLLKHIWSIIFRDSPITV